jgi:hypothetical protein
MTMTARDGRLTDDEFRARLIARLRRARPDLTFAPTDDPAVVRVARAGRDSGRVGLTHALARYRQGEGVEAIARGYVAGLATWGTPRDATWASASARLRLRVVAREEVARDDRVGQEAVAGGVALEAGAMTVWRPHDAGLALRLVLDGRETMQAVMRGDLAAWGRDEDECFAVARDLTRGVLLAHPPRRMTRQGVTTWAWQNATGYAATPLADLADLPPTGPGERHLIAAPHRDALTVVVLAHDDLAVIATVAALGRWLVAARASPYPLVPDALLTTRDGRLVRLDPRQQS